MKSIIAFCNKHGFTLKDDATEGEVIVALEAHQAKFTQAEADLKKFKDQAEVADVKSVFTQGLNEGRVVPAQEDSLLQVYKGNPEGLKEFISKTPEKTFTSKAVAAGGVKGEDDTAADAKFKKDDGTPLTYKDVLGNPKKYAKDMSEEDIAALRVEDERFETVK